VGRAVGSRAAMAIAAMTMAVGCCHVGQGPPACVHVPAAADATTIHGGNEAIVFLESKPYPAASGTVVDPGGFAVSGALIELFPMDVRYCNGRDFPNGFPDSSARIVSGVSDSGGAFCLSPVREGCYELRVSVGTGINVSHVYLRIIPDLKKRRSIVVRMFLGT
jgi:hypothetical protein